MKSIIIFLILLFISHSYAGSEQLKVQNDSTAAVKLKPFEVKSLTGALVLEIFVPTLGFLYAENWKKGILPVAFRISGLIMAYRQLDIGIMGGKTKIADKFLFTGGIVVWVTGWIWSYISLKNAVNDSNRSLRLSFMPSLGNPRKIMMTLSYSF